MRQRLYALKDEIGKANGVINACTTTKALSDEKRFQLDEIQALQKNAFEALGNLLSNHGMDWFEQQHAGGLSYLEFLYLKPLVIKEFEVQVSWCSHLFDDLKLSCSNNKSQDDREESKRSRFCPKQIHYGAKEIPKTVDEDDGAFAYYYHSVKATLWELNSLLKFEFWGHKSW